MPEIGPSQSAMMRSARIGVASRADGEQAALAAAALRRPVGLEIGVPDDVAGDLGLAPDDRDGQRRSRGLELQAGVVGRRTPMRDLRRPRRIALSMAHQSSNTHSPNTRAPAQPLSHSALRMMSSSITMRAG